MAVDYFLQLAGIQGESTDSQHKDWIDVLSWSFGETNSGTAAAGAGMSAGKVSMQDFHFTQRMSRASPKLFLACATGQFLKEAKLAAVKAGGSRQEFLVWTFTDVLVTSYQTGGSAGDDALLDQVSLRFSRVKVDYKPQRPDGTLDAAVTASFDLKTNRPA